MTLSYSAVIFDCDGVIFDSNALKTQAFRKVLLSYPQEAVHAFISYHQSQGGVSRYVKLRTFFSEFLKTPVKNDELERLLHDFGVACQELYQQASLTPSCLPVLETLSHSAHLFIASGSDETELRKVFISRGLNKFFSGIYGSPKTKQDCVSEIIQKLEPETNITFVGDAESDWKAASHAGIPFVFMSEFSDSRDFMTKKSEQGEFSIINTLHELLPLLKHSGFSGL